MPKLSWKRNQIIKKLKKSNIACIMSLSCSLAFTNVLAQQSQNKAYQKYSTKSTRKPMKRTSKIHQKEKTMTHFEMGVACFKNGFLRNSKDYIEEEKEIHYLKLAKQGEEKKTEWIHSWDLQENGSNGFLKLRGRRW